MTPQFSKRVTHSVRVGSVMIGTEHPTVIQSMTNTDTANIHETVKQIQDLVAAGSEIVRIPVNTEEAARAVPQIKDLLVSSNTHVPLVGCFHYNGHRLLERVPECGKALDKYRINPGNVGFGAKKKQQFRFIVEQAILYQKPIRIGVNWGSLDPEITAQLMNENAVSQLPVSSQELIKQALIRSALESAEEAIQFGLSPDRIVLSCKVSRVPDLIDLYQRLAVQCAFPLHLGLTEAGMGEKGIIATTAALTPLLSQGIGETIRASLTPDPGGSRCQEVSVCRDILQTLELRYFRPQISACPGCGRTSSSTFQALANSIDQYIQEKMPIWKKNHPGVEKLRIAVMGCIVNGPGESKHAHIGISLPGDGEEPAAPVFIEGQKILTLRGNGIAEKFKQILDEYVSRETYSD